MRDAVILGERREMHERHEQAERGAQRRRVQEHEGPGADRVAQAHAPRLVRRRHVRSHHAAVGKKSVALRRRVDQQRRGPAGQHDERAHDQIRAAPAIGVDQPFGDLRHHERTDPDSGHRDSGSEAALAHEPPLHGTERRHIRYAVADTDAEPEAEIDLP